MRRFLKIVTGFSLIAVGLLLSIPGVPGPGLLIAIGGVALLADHFHWARRLLDWCKARVADAKQKLDRRGADS
ncbi:MAG: PGPGW domain-containing protein [bacterium]|jgi:hypothetical protein